VQLTATATPTETGVARFVVEGQGTAAGPAVWYVDDLSAVGSPVGYAEDYFGIDGYSSVAGVTPAGVVQ